MNLVACINVFNEDELLPQVLEKGLEVFDEFIIADGAYVNRWPKPKSTDGTLEILEKFQREAGKPVTIIEREGYWPSEVYKRNWMLDLVKPGDWYFYVDADWLPIWKSGAREILLSIDDDYCSAVVHVRRLWAPRQFGADGKAEPLMFHYPYFACFKKQVGLHYVYNHCTVCDEDGRRVWELAQEGEWKIHKGIGIIYEELLRKDFFPRLNIKKQKFREGVVVESSSGMGGYCCNTCGYGIAELDSRGRSKGFKIPRGMPQVCKRCGSGDLALAINLR